MKKVSVCIPAYNAEKYIRATVESVLSSAYQNLEVVITDDASVDDTQEVVKAVKDERVNLFQNQVRLGVPHNWNRAVKKASGDYVGLLNHDDLYGPFWLTWAVHILDKYPHVGWVASAFRIIDGDGDLLKVVSRFTQTRECDQVEAFTNIARLDGLGPTYLIRRELLREVGYYDEGGGPSADNDLFVRLAAKYPMYYSANPHHAAWRQHSGNLTNRWSLVDQCFEGLSTLRKVFNNPDLPKKLLEKRECCYIYFYHKVLSRARERLEGGELDTVQRLVEILTAHGYNHC